MSAEAQACYADEWPEEAQAPLHNRPPSRVHSAPSTGTPAPAEEPAAPVSWNVLTEELVSFPRPCRHVLPGDAEASGEAATRGTATAAGEAARAHAYGRAWLEQELRTLRYLADAGYPAPGGDIRDALPHPELPVAARVDHANLRRPRLLSGVGEAGIARQMRPAAARTGGLRRLLPGIATLAALVGIWAGAGALSSLHDHSLVVPAGSVKAGAGYVYVVRPGDTLWSIAARLDPGGDPRPLVAQLSAQLHGGPLVPGTHLRLP